MRCGSCEKFVSMDMGDPEISTDLTIEINGNTASVEGGVRIVRVCADCGDELKEAELELSTDVEIPAEHIGEGHDIDIEQTEIDTIEESGGRYAKSYFGAQVHFHVTCSCQKEPIVEGSFSDKVAASGMDEIG